MQFVGEITQGRGPQPMTKDAEGLWTITVAPARAGDLELQLPRARRRRRRSLEPGGQADATRRRDVELRSGARRRAGVL